METLKLHILEQIIQPREEENIVQTSPDKLPSFIPLQPDAEPEKSLSKPFDEMSVSFQHPDKAKPESGAEDAPKTLVNGKLERRDDEQTPSTTPLSAINVTVPLDENAGPIKVIQKPLESVE